MGRDLVLPFFVGNFAQESLGGVCGHLWIGEKGEHWGSTEGMAPNRPQFWYLIDSVSDEFGIR